METHREGKAEIICLHYCWSLLAATGFALMGDWTSSQGLDYLDWKRRELILPVDPVHKSMDVACLVDMAHVSSQAAS
jgi:hypothetical protein